MKKNKIITAFCALALSTAVFAQDFETESFTTDVTDFNSNDTAPVGFTEGFEENAPDENSFGSGFDLNPNPLSIGGTAAIETRGVIGKTEGFFFPKLTLDFFYAGLSSDFAAKLNFSEKTLVDYPADILDELVFRFYVGDFIIEGGKLKIVWGKGDKLHVLDNFNANDFTDFIIPEYIDRRIAEPMLRVIWNAGIGTRVEAAYAPFMTPDRAASSGIWAPSAQAALHKSAEEVLLAQAKVALAGGNFAQLSAIMAKSGSILPSTRDFSYGQAGLRVTQTFGMVDFGASYYFGRYKQPTANMAGYLAAKRQQAAGYPLALANDSALPVLDYDRLQVFGLEGAAAVGRFNVRAEAAYYLTPDTAGNDPWVRNNSFNWLAGFDVNLPVHNVNLNIQNIGSYVVNNNKIGDGSVPKEYDADYSKNGAYTRNKIAFLITDTFWNEKLELSCNFTWGIEGAELLVLPKINYAATENLCFILSGMYIYTNSDGEFYDFRDNSFVQFGISYRF